MENLNDRNKSLKKINNYVYRLAKECVEAELKRKEAYLFIEIKGLMPEFKKWKK